MTLRLFAWSLLTVLAVGCVSFSRSSESVVYDTGVVHRTITTSSPEAQLWFDRGLALTFGFNHEEAIVCFDRAIAADPGCAMAHWGRAYAFGPNYNNPLPGPEAERAAFEAASTAKAQLDDETPAEFALVEALTKRHDGRDDSDRPALDVVYAEAMRSVRAAHPDDGDLAAFTAEALMQVKPWLLWSADGQPAPETPEIVALLEESLERWPSHPALCHLYIHAVEASPNPERALAAARRLERLVPGSGHLTHMPSHIYVWTGHYDDVIRVNIEAVELDRAYVEHAGRGNFYTLYRLHNYHFVAYGGMWEGRSELALANARELVSEIPAGLLAEIPDYLDVFTATPYHVLVRFGRWDEILAEPEPVGELFAARAVWCYARTVALASLGRVEDARAEYQSFLAAKAAVPTSRMLFQNTVSSILEVAEPFALGEIEYRAGNHDRAFELLRRAVALDEQLNYDEPWGWMEPVRHALGALLLEQGHYAEAADVYRANLERYPENGWALHGLAECLRGLGREDDAREVDARFAKAWARADVDIPGSCFCKGVTATPVSMDSLDR